MEKKHIGKSLLTYPQSAVSLYERELGIMGSLSNLYSTSSSPLIQYRATENIYCSVFNAKNVSREDCTADAIIGKTGIGIKTFLASTRSQKIAEFNKEAPIYRDLNTEDKVRKIALLRNERIAFTMRSYALERMIYHCITRDEGGEISVFEEPMHSIQLSSLKITKVNDNKILFSDGLENYEFYLPKSTLFKIFNDTPSFIDMNVNILSNPMNVIMKAFQALNINVFSRTPSHSQEAPFIIIPLYSHNRSRGDFVPEKSGLNQWNADGRPRNPDEVYIPYPKSLREKHPDFFPPRDQSWEMELPSGQSISMKICQESGKALMSNPNKDLGHWLLRDVFALKPREILTYQKMLECGIDSVIIKKLSDSLYSIDFYRSDAN